MKKNKVNKFSKKSDKKLNEIETLLKKIDVKFIDNGSKPNPHLWYLNSDDVINQEYALRKIAENHRISFKEIK